MRRPTPIPTVTAALAVLITLTSCSNVSGPDSSTPASSSATATASSPDEDEPTLGPLDDYVGIGAGVASHVDDAETLKYEEAIARCMADEGFEYVPYVAPFDATFLPDGTVTLAETKPSFPDLPPDQFAARFGYGISTKPPAVREQEADPNDAIVARMGVAERVAYHQALYGRDTPLDDQGYIAGPGIRSSETSCSARADAGAPTTEELANAAKRADQVRKSFASLLKRVRALKDEERSDPRMTAATAAWSRCLTSSGHPGFDALDEPRARARSDAERLLGRDLLGADEADPTRLAALRKAEVELAVADEQCLGDWRKTLDAVQDDLEERFVRENIDELKEFRSAMSAAVAEQR